MEAAGLSPAPTRSVANQTGPGMSLPAGNKGFGRKGYKGRELERALCVCRQGERVLGKRLMLS